MTRTITISVIVATTIIITAYDILVYIEPTRGDTISEVLLWYAYNHPVIPWMWGGLAGHLFWPMKTYGRRVVPIPFFDASFPTKTYRTHSLITLVIATVTLGVMPFAGILLSMNPATFLLPGIAAGHWGWPQTTERRRG